MKWLSLVCGLLGWLSSASAHYQIDTSPDYEFIFGQDYQKALDFCKEHQSYFEMATLYTKIPKEELAAIVFPEMIRYSLLKDFFETAALEQLYVSGGSLYADFSIGAFQMKPSFIEKLELAVSQKAAWTNSFDMITQYSSTDIVSIRKQRLDRMKTLEWQLVYVCCFYKMVLHKYQNDTAFGDIPLVKFMATAYNAGTDRTASSVVACSQQKCFPHGTNYPEKQQHAYADVAYDFYIKHAKQLFIPKK